MYIHVGINFLPFILMIYVRRSRKKKFEPFEHPISCNEKCKKSVYSTNILAFKKNTNGCSCTFDGLSSIMLNIMTKQ